MRKYVQPGKTICPNCGEIVLAQEDYDETIVIPDINIEDMEEISDIKPLGEMADLDFEDEIKYEDDELEDFDFPQDSGDEDFQFEDDEEDLYDDEPSEMDKAIITNENKKMNIIAIAVSV